MTYPWASAWGKRARSREPGPGLAEAETAGHRLVVLAGVGKTRLGAAARNADHRSLARALYVVHLAALLHLRPPTLTRLAPRPCPTHTTLIATFIFGPEIEPSICKSPSACSLQPTSHPASDRLPGCLPLSQSMVRTASNRLVRRHDNKITKLKWGLSWWLDRQVTGIRNTGVEHSCLILNMELIIKTDDTLLHTHQLAVHFVSFRIRSIWN